MSSLRQGMWQIRHETVVNRSTMTSMFMPSFSEARYRSFLSIPLSKL